MGKNAAVEESAEFAFHEPRDMPPPLLLPGEERFQIFLKHFVDKGMLRVPRAVFPGGIARRGPTLCVVQHGARLWVRGRMRHASATARPNGGLKTQGLAGRAFRKSGGNAEMFVAVDQDFRDSFRTV
jgi:hypothetical protein